MSLEKEKKQISQISEQEEKVIKESTEIVEDFKDELPITKEEATETCDVIETYLNEIEKVMRPIEVLGKGLFNGINDAKEKWNIKWTEKEEEKTKNIIRNALNTLEQNPEEIKNLIVKSKETNQYYLNPDRIFDFINNKIDKKDRKFIKKVVKAILKTKKQEEYQRIKAEKKDAKERNRIRKKLFINPIK